MTVIDSYLDTLFSPYPDTERMRAAREELRGMMEDKQHDLVRGGATEAQAVGQVIAEFGSLDEVADVLGIRPEVDGTGTVSTDPHVPEQISLDRAEAYVQRVRETQILTAISTPLLVLSPIALLFALWLSDTGRALTDEIAVGIGLVVLLVVIAAGVLLGMRRDAQVRPFADIENGDFTPSREVTRYAERLVEEGGTRSGKGLAVALFILSPLCVILPPLIGSDDLALLGTVGTLLLVGLGLFFWIAPNGPTRAAEHLLREHEDQDDPESSTSPVLRAVAAVWWPLTIAVFLVWGLAFDGWDRSWVLFPVSGILYGALWALSGALNDRETSRQR